MMLGSLVDSGVISVTVGSSVGWRSLVNSGGVISG